MRVLARMDCGLKRLCEGLVTVDEGVLISFKFNFSCILSLTVIVK